MNHHYINGAWTKGLSETLTSINPVDNQTIWTGHQATESDINHAYQAAADALPAWSELHTDARAEYLRAFATHIEKERNTLTRWIELETGKPHWEAETETQAVISKIQIAIQAYQARTPDQHQLDSNIASTHLRYKPHGVFVILGAFNFPAHLSNGHIVPALLAGNTVIYKPSELTPAVAAFMMQCWHAIGLPKGVLNLVQGDATVAKSLFNYPIQGVAFTGSYRAGLAIHQQFSNRPEVILALEMGGNNPLVIGEVHDINAAVYQALLSCYITAGQRCSCARRLIIPKTKAGDLFLDTFIQATKRIIIGAPHDHPPPFIGPVIRHQHAQRHLEAQAALIQQGAISLLPMKLTQPGLSFLSPGILDMTSVQNPPDEEIFAPLANIYRYEAFDDALRLANQTRYGLVAGLFSDDADAYAAFFKHVRAGLIYWNRATTGASSNLPFGGIGHSGNHRPSAYFAADYCAYPIASLEQTTLSIPDARLPGITIGDK